MLSPQSVQPVAGTIPELLKRNATTFGEDPAYRVKEFGIWRSWTWSETYDEIKGLALGFLEFGVEVGDHVEFI